MSASRVNQMWDLIDQFSKPLISFHILNLYSILFFFLRYFIVCLQTSIELLISEYIGGLVSVCDFASPLVSRPGGGWDKVQG